MTDSGDPERNRVNSQNPMGLFRFDPERRLYLRGSGIEEGDREAKNTIGPIVISTTADFWTRLAAIVSVFGVIILVAYTYFTRGLLEKTTEGVDQSRVQAQAALQQLEASERPWVFPTMSIESPLTFLANGRARISLRFTLENIGHSPAWVRIIPGALQPFDVDSAAPAPEGTCAQLYQKGVDPSDTYGSPKEPKMEPLVLPGKQVQEEWDVDAAAKDISAAVRHAEAHKIAGIAAFFVVGCLDYASRIPAKRYQTGFVFLISKIQPQISKIHSPNPFFLPSDGSVPIPSMNLVWNGGYAN
jgi:hypothetical protein